MMDSEMRLRTVGGKRVSESLVRRIPQCLGVLLVAGSASRLVGDGSEWPEIWWVRQLGLSRIEYLASAVEVAWGAILICVAKKKLRMALGLLTAFSLLVLHVVGEFVFQSSICGCLGESLVPGWAFIGILGLSVVAMATDIDRMMGIQWTRVGVALAILLLCGLCLTSGRRGIAVEREDRLRLMAEAWTGRSVWVVSGGCAHCDDALRQIGPNEDVVVLLREDDPHLARFRSAAAGSAREVQSIDTDLWWALVGDAPPAHYRVDGREWHRDDKKAEADSNAGER